MHDARGRELRVGDKVLVPAVIKDVYASEDYCNVSVVTELGRRPDDAKESISAINTAVMYRANPGDVILDLLP